MSRSLCIVVLAAAVVALPTVALKADLIELEPSLVGYWKLDDPVGSTTVVDSKSGYIGTIYGGVTLGQKGATQMLGTAASFNRSANGKIDIPWAAALNPTEFTIEAWSRIVGTVGQNDHRSPLTSRASSPVSGYMFYALPNNTGWSFQTGIGTTWNSIASPSSAVEGQWVHLAGTQNAANNKVFYINGNPVVSTTSTFAANPSAPQRIGAGATEGSGAYFFNGDVDNVAVFNQALAHQKISDHYNSFSPYARTILADNPVAYWRLGEQAGTTAYNAKDVTKYAGTYQNGAAIRQITDTATLFPDVDTAVDFDGVDDRVQVPYSVDLHPAGSFSVELWAKVEGGQDSYRSPLTARGHTGGQQGYLFYAASNNRWEFWTGNGTGWDVSSGPLVEVDKWAHLVGTFLWDGNPPDGNGALSGIKTLYVNGVSVVSAAGKYKPMLVATNPLWIGTGNDDGSSFRFNGKIDEVAFYNYALTAQQVAAHFAASVPEPTSLGLLFLGLCGLMLRGRYRW